jgi:Ca2+-binding EF-hand superfamily protein
MEKTGAISKREFKYFLDFWGFEIDAKTFESVFATFDLDGDGKISYKDF